MSGTIFSEEDTAELRATMGAKMRARRLELGLTQAKVAMMIGKSADETKALLREEVLEEWVWQKLHTIGTAACPPYHRGHGPRDPGHPG